MSTASLPPLPVALIDASGKVSKVAAMADPREAYCESYNQLGTGLRAEVPKMFLEIRKNGELLNTREFDDPRLSFIDTFNQQAGQFGLSANLPCQCQGCHQHTAGAELCPDCMQSIRDGLAHAESQKEDCERLEALAEDLAALTGGRFEFGWCLGSDNGVTADGPNYVLDGNYVEADEATTLHVASQGDVAASLVAELRRVATFYHDMANVVADKASAERGDA